MSDVGERSQIARAFRVLELLAASPRTASQIAPSFGIDRSTALRLLRELEATGYVTRNEGTKRYSIVGSRFYLLLANTRDHADLSELVDPLLREVRDEFGEGTILAVPSGDSMVYLEFFPSDHILAVREALGAIRPMHCSAVGKAYLSALEPTVLGELVGRLSFDAGTHNAAKDGTELIRRVELAREIGYAVDRDETSLGVSCVATPLWVGDSLIGAVGATGPSSRFPDEVAGRIGMHLQRAVEQIRRPNPAFISSVGNVPARTAG